MLESKQVRHFSQWDLQSLEYFRHYYKTCSYSTIIVKEWAPVIIGKEWAPVIKTSTDNSITHQREGD
jgi:hypothetical protein